MRVFIFAFSKAVHQWQGQAEANHQLFQVEQEKHHQVLSWYQAEQEKTQS